MPASKYKPEYCQQLIDHMAEGRPFKTFGAVAEVSKQTLYDWTNAHEDFKEAKDIGRAKSEYFWTDIGLKLAIGELKGSAVAWIFCMKNLHGWNDNKDGQNDREQQPINIQIVRDDSGT